MWVFVAQFTWHLLKCSVLALTPLTLITQSLLQNNFIALINIESQWRFLSLSVHWWSCFLSLRGVKERRYYYKRDFKHVKSTWNWDAKIFTDSKLGKVGVCSFSEYCYLLFREISLPPLTNQSTVTASGCPLVLVITVSSETWNSFVLLIFQCTT